MGRKIQPRTLKTSSLLKIVDNLERRWRSGDYEDVSHILGPPECLTPDLVQEIVNHFTAKYSTSGDFLERLIDGRLDTLDLHECERAATDQVLKLVSVRCQSLTHLNIEGTTASAKTISRTVSSLPNIRILNLNETPTNDDILRSIGNSCHELEELYIARCPITDKGLTNLCIGTDYNPKVPNLWKLEIQPNHSSNAYTANGILSLLKNCKALREINHGHICDVLHLLCKREGRPDQNLKLTTLRIHGRLPGNTWPLGEAIQSACALCSQISELSICSNISEADLQYIARSQDITRLHIASTSFETMSFDHGLRSFLQLRGASLEKLSVVDIDKLDIGVIGYACPNLSDLRIHATILCDPITFTTSDPPENRSLSTKAPFTKLVELVVNLGADGNIDISAQSMKILLSNCVDLKKLELEKIRCLDSTLLRDILKHNPMQHLEILRVEECARITIKPLYGLCLNDGALRELHLSACRKITRNNNECLQQRIHENKLDIETHEAHVQKLRKRYTNNY